MPRRVSGYAVGMAPLWFRLAARARGVASRIGLLALVLGVIGMFVLPDAGLLDTVPAIVALVGFVLFALGMALSLIPGGPRIEPRVVASPVAGRWMALNSPANKVPSHGTHGYGQTFGIDLAYEPEPGARPKFGAGPAFRPPEDFPGFGQPLHSPVDGRVISVQDGARDHRSRSTWPALIYLMVAEGFVRELAGSGRVLGNHVVIDLGNGAYAVLAHLQRGSATVVPGQLVHGGDVVGRCGNSGNTTEPHVHFQLQDHRSPSIAAGLPFVFQDVSIDGSERRDGVPGNEEYLEALVGSRPGRRQPGSAGSRAR